MAEASTQAMITVLMPSYYQQPIPSRTAQPNFYYSPWLNGLSTALLPAEQGAVGQHRPWLQLLELLSVL